jgi:hypothetical protein
VTSQKTPFFIVTVMKTSNVTTYFLTVAIDSGNRRLYRRDDGRAGGSEEWNLRNTTTLMASKIRLQVDGSYNAEEDFV